MTYGPGFFALLGVVLCVARPAAATYSIVAADQESRQVGGAGTSCIEGDDVYVIYRAIPGVGVVHAQAALNFDGRDRAFELLGQGLAPQAILDEITAPDFDPTARNRQYAIADLQGRIAAFTGSTTRAYAADVQGTDGSLTYSVQGNILTSADVLTQAAGAFESGCDLADRLMLALEAGAENGEGDSRCSDAGIPSDSAFLQVEAPDRAAGEFLSLRVPTSGTQNPLIELRADYDAWRSAHPCPAPMPVAGAAGSSGSGGAGNGGGGSGGSGGVSNGGATGGGVALPAGNAGKPGAPEPEPAAGCGCRMSSQRSTLAVELSIVMLSARRRRRSRTR